jgi:DNA-binding MarR family transcriptional regulator
MSDHREGFDSRKLDEVIHGRVRLGVMAFLASAGEATFVTLKDRLGATDGNLSIQLGKLEEAGYVVIIKGFEGKKPRTTIRFTDAGRSAWIAYLDQIRSLLAADVSF